MASGSTIDAEKFAQTERKYAEERDKRLRLEGVSQYVDLLTSEKLKRFQTDPWSTSESPQERAALKNGDHCGVLIIGCGFGGLLFAVRLIQAGIPVSQIRMVDIAGGYGGTWYWNRYPGVMCDCESYIYMPLLEEMGYMPKNRYAYGPEIRAYAEKITDKYQLRDNTLFQTKVDGFHWDDSANEWIVELTKYPGSKRESKITVHSRFTMIAPGVLNNPKMAHLPGVDEFQGPIFHTSRWDYSITGGSPTDPSLTKLKDKRVGIIGTGATAVQSVPHLAEWSKELYIFQRTPSAVDRRDNYPTDPKVWAEEIANKKGWFKERAENFNAHISNVVPKPAVNLVNDSWSNIPAFSALVGGPVTVTPEAIPEFITSLHTLDFPRQERVRERVDEIVKDKNTAAKLKPWYPSWCKRPCFHDEYLQTFNRDNVHLVDTAGKGVTSISENGILAEGRLYELDIIIFSTGFRPPPIGTPASRANIEVTGRNGRNLNQKFEEDVGTLHGIITRDFPNLFFFGPQAAATANFTFVLDVVATHAAYIINASAKKLFNKNGNYNFIVEPTLEAEERWTAEVVARAACLAGASGCTPSYFNNEGETDRIQGMEERIKAAKGAIWGRGIAEYDSVIGKWRNEGKLEGLEITPVS
ncbi:monooxygenase [Xylogone sp. PMI_703]|nr:monooxygenase [Xylogone sp. PMI_703]